jgi:hypothetical protein
MARLAPSMSNDVISEGDISKMKKNENEKKI